MLLKLTELARDCRFENYAEKGTLLTLKLENWPSGGQNRVIVTRRPMEHIKQLGRDQCKLWKLTELARDFRFEN